MKHTIKVLMAGCAVYAVMAACSGSQHADPFAESRAAAPPYGQAAGAAPRLSGAQGGAPGQGGATLTLQGGTQGAGGAISGPAGGSTPAQASGGAAIAAGGGILNPVPNASAETISGTRLRAQYFVGEDGAKVFHAWKDTRLGVSCSFQNTASGVQRCLPLESEVRFAAYYADGACLTPVFKSAQGCVEYGWVRENAACPVSVQAYRLRPVPAGTPATAWVKSNGVCSLAGAFAVEAWDFLGERIPDTELVAAQLVTE